MRCRIRLREFDYEILYFLGLFNQVLHVLSRLLHPLENRSYKQKNDDIPRFESSPAATEQHLKEKREIDISFWIILLRPSIFLRVFPASYIPVEENRVDSFNINDLTIKSSEPQALDN